MGRPAKDLTGQQFGYWLVIERVGSTEHGKREPVWCCRCICGSEKNLTSGHLRSGSCLSCGCKTAELNSEAHVKDLTGLIFGKLIVLRRNKQKSNGVWWDVQCDCGTEKTLSSDNLHQTKSCGCLVKEHHQQYIKDETGNFYNRLEVIGPAFSEGGEWYWHCVCTCGKETAVRGSHLRSGAVQSCGCLNDENRIKAITTHGLTHTREYQRIQGRKRYYKEKYLDIDWNAEKEIFLRRLFQECVVCGMTEQEHQKEYGKSLWIDHIYPLSKGHGLSVENATILCAKCNREKHARDLNNLPERMRNRILLTSDIFKLLYK